MAVRSAGFQLPAGIVLPYYARPDLAYVSTSKLPQVVINGQAYKVTSDLEIPLAFTATVTTGVAAGNRLVTLTMRDQDGTTILDLPAATTQGPSLIYDYEWMAGVSVSVANVNLTNPATVAGFLLTPIPPILLYPSSSILLSAFQPAFDSSSGSISYTRILIPTGPALADEQAGPATVAPLVL